MFSHKSTAQTPSFSRTWLLPVPALSSPQIVMRPASSRLPKNFQPVGVSKHGMPSFAATRSTARARWHRAGHARKTAAIGRREVRVRRQHCQGIRGRDEDAAADDQVAVAVAIRRCAEVGRIGRPSSIEQVLGVNEVWVGVVAAEIGQGRAVAHCAGSRAEFALENGIGIGAGDRVHGIEGEPQAIANAARSAENRTARASARRNRLPDR